MANKQTGDKLERHQTTVRIDKYEALKQLAEERKWSFNTALNDAVEFYLAHQQQKIKTSKTEQGTALHSTYEAHLTMVNNMGYTSDWKMPENKLNKALFRIQVAQTLVEFFKLEERGNAETASELLDPYERGVEDEIKSSGFRFEHPEYQQGHNDYREIVKTPASR